MKYCPICDARYDEDEIQFCTKDGTPLVEADEPRFTALPSENSDDAGEDTVIRRRGDTPVVTETSRNEPIVIPTTEPVGREPVRPRSREAYYAPPPEQNTGKVIALTILGTIAAIGFGALLFWALTRNNQPTNLNVNTMMPNMNANVNSNGFDSNFNFNSNVQFPNVNLPIPNININANVRTPTPTPTPKPSATPTASPIPTETPEATPRPTGTPRPTPSATPRTGPRPPGNLSGV